MNNNTAHNSAFVLLPLICLLAFGGCSQKPSSEEIAAQVKAAMAEEKAKEQAAAATATPPAPEVKTEAPKPAAKPVRSVQAKPAPAKKPVCDNCGVVVSVNEIEQKGKGSGLGAIAGGVAGGVVGNQVGQGTGRDLATIAGVVGGAIAGNKVEENMKKTRVYDVTVKMEGGEERVMRFDTLPGVSAGDKVKVEGEHITKQ